MLGLKLCTQVYKSGMQTKANKRWIRTRLSELHRQQFGLCFYCKDPIVLYESKPLVPSVDMATYDHIRPLAGRSGTKYRRTPGVAACHTCNVFRGKESFFKFYLRSKQSDYLTEIFKRKQRLLSRELTKFGI